jgi:CubicO group peptidase (beta-lactamase class C family)
VYSDLFFVMAPEGISRICGMDYIQFLDSIYYKPLGARSITYNPWQKFPVDRIVPTENDTYYRKRQLQGSVHDESAAILGGVSGNAGLFATANDLAKLLQMYVQMGTYGGKQYLKESTLKEFTRVQYPENNNRRGLGFDKPLSDNWELEINKAYPAPGASPESFGHSGYTGTFFWIDPVHQLVYIFLSNRVYPTRNNTQLIDMNIRTKIQQVLYDEIRLQHP